MYTLETAGGLQALEKTAVAPLLAAGGRALLGGFTALGLLGAGSDIYSGIRDGSVGQTAFGLAQVPLALAAGGKNSLKAIGLGSVGRFLGRLPLMRRSIYGINQAGLRIGGAASGLAARGVGRAFGPEALQSVQGALLGKRLVGAPRLSRQAKMGLGIAIPYLGHTLYSMGKGLSAAGYGNQGVGASGLGIGSVTPEQDVRNIAPKLSLGAPGMPFIPQDKSLQSPIAAPESYQEVEG